MTTTTLTCQFHDHHWFDMPVSWPPLILRANFMTTTDLAYQFADHHWFDATTSWLPLIWHAKEWVNNCWWGWQNRIALEKCTHLYDEIQRTIKHKRFRQKVFIRCKKIDNNRRRKERRRKSFYFNSLSPWQPLIWHANFMTTTDLACQFHAPPPPPPPPIGAACVTPDFGGWQIDLISQDEAHHSSRPPSTRWSAGADWLWLQSRSLRLRQLVLSWWSY